MKRWRERYSYGHDDTYTATRRAMEIADSLMRSKGLARALTIAGGRLRDVEAIGDPLTVRIWQAVIRYLEARV